MTNMRMEDKDWMNDCLMTEKHLTGAYATAALEAENEALRRDFMTICREEESNAKMIFQAMKGHGWYRPQAADAAAISQARSQFQGQQPTM